MNKSKIIEILDPQAGRVKETEIEEVTENSASHVEGKSLFEGKRGQRMTLQEASTLNEFPVLLRDGIRSITFDSYANVQTTWQQWVMATTSDKQSEDWAEENSLGELPVVNESTPYPVYKLSIDRTVNIRNYKRGGVIEVTEEMIRFNRLNILKRHAERLGRSAANTREQASYSVINTAGNYVRNSTTGDNDVGANTASTNFSASGLNTALNTLRTMKDRISGAYLGVSPNMLIVGPLLEMAAKQLLLAPNIQIPGDGVTTAKVYGTGTVNPFRGLVGQIIVSPRFATGYQWCLMEAKQGVVLQEVDGLQILQEAPGRIDQEAYFMWDVLRYRVRDWYGLGMLNDRFCFYSSNNSAPSVA